MFILFPLDNEDHSMLIMYSNLFMPLFGTIRMTRLVQGFDYFTFQRGTLVKQISWLS